MPPAPFYPECGYRGFFGNCMANPGYSCAFTRSIKECLKERERGECPAK